MCIRDRYLEAHQKEKVTQHAKKIYFEIFHRTAWFYIEIENDAQNISLKNVTSF